MQEILGMGRFPWNRKWYPTLVFLPGKFHGQSSPVGYSPWGCKESDMTLSDWALLLDLNSNKVGVVSALCSQGQPQCLIQRRHLIVTLLWLMTELLGEAGIQGTGPRRSSRIWWQLQNHRQPEPALSEGNQTKPTSLPERESLGFKVTLHHHLGPLEMESG